MSRERPTGACLGIDVGFSAKRKSTCFCLLTWDPEHCEVQFKMVSSELEERRDAIRELVGHLGLDGVAVDGPLASGLRIVPHYRSAEAVLSRGVLQKRGKPGATSAPLGQKLHCHATQLVQLVIDESKVAKSDHFEPIHEKRVVEAFPNLFLAAMVPERDLPKLSRDASDRFWEILVDRSNRLEHLWSFLLPWRRLDRDLQALRDHDHRAAFVCALTALTVLRKEQVQVGDKDDGDIMLPPTGFWGLDALGDPWLLAVLRANVRTVRLSKHANLNHRNARLV